MSASLTFSVADVWHGNGYASSSSGTEEAGQPSASLAFSVVDTWHGNRYASSPSGTEEVKWMPVSLMLL